MILNIPYHHFKSAHAGIAEFGSYLQLNSNHKRKIDQRQRNASDPIMPIVRHRVILFWQKFSDKFLQKKKHRMETCLMVHTGKVALVRVEETGKINGIEHGWIL